MFLWSAICQPPTPHLPLFPDSDASTSTPCPVFLAFCLHKKFISHLDTVEILHSTFLGMRCTGSCRKYCRIKVSTVGAAELTEQSETCLVGTRRGSASRASPQSRWSPHHSERGGCLSCWAWGRSLLGLWFCQRQAGRRDGWSPESPQSMKTSIGGFQSTLASFFFSVSFHVLL